MQSAAQAPVVMPPGAAHDARPDGGASQWDLLYVSNAGNGTVTVYRYWQRVLFATLTGFKNPNGECVDKANDVFVTDSGLQAIVEYHHAGKAPINTLSDAGYQPVACSVDPLTGNLAVANYATASGGPGNVAIYAGATGKPAFYTSDLDGKGPLSCGYDDQGNLLVADEYSRGNYEYASFAMLPKNSKAFQEIRIGYIAKSHFEYVTNVQWDGKYWATVDNGNILRFTIAGSHVTYEGATNLSGNWTGTTQLSIVNFTGSDNQQGTQLVAAEANDVLTWKYPAGGTAIGAISQGVNQPYGVVVSLKKGH
jgi:hypothetical protein